jgi:hypothetical protein
MGGAHSGHRSSVSCEAAITVRAEGPFLWTDSPVRMKIGGLGNAIINKGGVFLSPRGNFLTAIHTRKHYREHWYPEIISRDNYDTWSETGENLKEIYRRRAQEILTSHQPTSLSTLVEEEIIGIIRRFNLNYSFDSN